MKNFNLDDWNILKAFDFTLLSPKALDSMIEHLIHNKFWFSRLQEINATMHMHFGLLSPKTLDSNFPDIRYVAFIKNFDIADWNEMRAIKAHFGLLKL